MADTAVATPPAAPAPVVAAPAAVAPPAPAVVVPPAVATPAPVADAKPAVDAAKPAEKKSSILGGVTPKEGEAKTEPQKTGAPEKYADFKMPEGVALDKEALAKAEPLFKKHGFSQDVAQEFVDFQAQNLKAEIEGRLNAVTQQSEAWAKESREQFGASWEREFANAAKGIESFGTPKMREILMAVGLDNHPEFVAMFARVGAKMSEGQPVDGKTAGNERVPTEKLMFDKMGPKK